MSDPWGISGPDFVVLYIALLGAVLLIRLIVSAVFASRALRADNVQPGPPPTVYQLAFLAGGPDRAVDAAIAALVERGQLRVNSYKQISQAGTRPVEPLERAVADVAQLKTTATIRAPRPRLRGDARPGGGPGAAGPAGVGGREAAGADVRARPAAGRGGARRGAAGQRHLARPVGRGPGVPGADRGGADDRGRGPAVEDRGPAPVGRRTAPARPGPVRGERAGAGRDAGRAACCSAAPRPLSPSAVGRCTRTKS